MNTEGAADRHEKCATAFRMQALYPLENLSSLAFCIGVADTDPVGLVALHPPDDEPREPVEHGGLSDDESAGCYLSIRMIREDRVQAQEVRECPDRGFHAAAAHGVVKRSDKR